MCESRISTPEPETPKASLGFPREARITRGAELQRVAHEGKRIRTTYLEVRVATSPRAHLPEGRPRPRMRIGIIVPRFKHSAVARNQLKRRLRELARIELLPSGMAADVVIRIRPDAYVATFEHLARDIARTVAQLSREMTLMLSAPPPGLTKNPAERDPT